MDLLLKRLVVRHGCATASGHNLTLVCVQAGHHQAGEHPVTAVIPGVCKLTVNIRTDEAIGLGVTRIKRAIPVLVEVQVGVVAAAKGPVPAIKVQVARYAGVENGVIIGDSAAERRALDEEVERRVKMVYGMRMFRSLAVPFSFRQQSPYWAIISEFHKIEDEHGAEIADYWLLENHPDLWSYTGRKYATNGVVAGTLEGHQKYLAHQEFADRYPELGGFITGAVGAIDVQFEYNRAVRDEEIRSGRKEYLDPGGILTEASESIGWREY